MIEPTIFPFVQIQLPSKFNVITSIFQSSIIMPHRIFLFIICTCVAQYTQQHVHTLSISSSVCVCSFFYEREKKRSKQTHLHVSKEKHRCWGTLWIHFASVKKGDTSNKKDNDFLVCVWERHTERERERKEEIKIRVGHLRWLSTNTCALL